jgi:hypothetical protein
MAVRLATVGDIAGIAGLVEHYWDGARRFFDH